jgi:hypothetical protein
MMTSVEDLITKATFHPMCLSPWRWSRKLMHLARRGLRVNNRETRIGPTQTPPETAVDTDRGFS